MTFTFRQLSAKSGASKGTNIDKKIVVGATQSVAFSWFSGPVIREKIKLNNRKFSLLAFVELFSMLC